ncbi:MAG: hypothetical protein RRY52_07850, partial [Anaerovoracaceae bacterium]
MARFCAFGGKSCAKTKDSVGFGAKVVPRRNRDLRRLSFLAQKLCQLVVLAKAGSGLAPKSLIARL